MLERIVRESPAAILVFAAFALITTAIAGVVPDALAVTQSVLGAGLLLIAALLPRLEGPQKVGPTGIELNIDSFRLEGAIERAAADEGLERVETERLSSAVAAALQAAGRTDPASQLVEIANAAVQSFANPRALRRALERAILRVAEVLRVDVTTLGAHCWVIVPHEGGEALARVARARLGATPPNPPRRWIKGRGTVGRCWERGEDVFDDLAAVEGPDEVAAQSLGLTAEEVQRARRDFRAIWAAPMYAGDRFVGCVSLNLDSDYHDPLSDDTVREIRRVLREAAEDCSLLLASPGSGGDI